MTPTATLTTATLDNAAVNSLATLAQQFWRQGFLWLPSFFDQAAMEKLQTLLVNHYGQSPAYYHNQEFLQRAATEIVPWFPQREGVSDFDELERASPLIALTDAILGAGWRSLYCMTMYSPPGSKGQAWHQDCPPEHPAHFNINRLVYSASITDEIGGQLVLVPGSHRRGAISAGPVDETMVDQQLLKPAMGDLLLIHGHTWHRVLPVTAAGRVSTNFRSIPQHTSEDITDIGVYRNMRYHFPSSRII